MQRSDASAVLPSEGHRPLPRLFWRKALAILLFQRTVSICQRHGEFGDEGHERCRSTKTTKAMKLAAKKPSKRMKAKMAAMLDEEWLRVNTRNVKTMATIVSGPVVLALVAC